VKARGEAAEQPHRRPGEHEDDEHPHAGREQPSEELLVQAEQQVGDVRRRFE
jgi:hypothetical protein